MFVIYSDDHNLHDGLLDPRGDTWRPSSECPARANNVLNTIREQGFGELMLPKEFADDRLTTIHDRDYLKFLQTVWQDWVDAGDKGANARPDTFVGAGMRRADTATM